MTDKQIIIDGVDVSGCKHYKNRTCIADYCLTDMPFGEAKCELNPNCHYKQLKRKEQECERLKKQVDITQMFLDACNNSCEHYKQTLTEIKEIIEQGVKIHDDIIVSKQILQKIGECEVE